MEDEHEHPLLSTMEPMDDSFDHTNLANSMQPNPFGIVSPSSFVQPGHFGQANNVQAGMCEIPSHFGNAFAHPGALEGPSHVGNIELQPSAFVDTNPFANETAHLYGLQQSIVFDNACGITGALQPPSNCDNAFGFTAGLEQPSHFGNVSNPSMSVVQPFSSPSMIGVEPSHFGNAFSPPMISVDSSHFGNAFSPPISNLEPSHVGSAFSPPISNLEPSHVGIAFSPPIRPENQQLGNPFNPHNFVGPSHVEAASTAQPSNLGNAFSAMTGESIPLAIAHEPAICLSAPNGLLQPCHFPLGIALEEQVCVPHDNPVVGSITSSMHGMEPSPPSEFGQPVSHTSQVEVAVGACFPAILGEEQYLDQYSTSSSCVPFHVVQGHSEPVQSQPMVEQQFGIPMLGCASVAQPETAAPCGVHHPVVETPEVPHVDLKLSSWLEPSVPKNIADNSIVPVSCPLQKQEGTEMALSVSQPQPQATEVQAVAVAKQPMATGLTKIKTVGNLKPLNEDTLEEKPALVRIQDGRVLSATVSQPLQTAEWDWSRAFHAIGIQTNRESRYLRENSERHSAELIEAEIPLDAITYRGSGSQDVGRHTMGSSALLLMIITCALNRRFTPKVKAKALSLAIGLVQLAVHTLQTTEYWAGMCYSKAVGYWEESLVLQPNGIVLNFDELLQHHPPAMWAWNHLMQQSYLERTISSSPSHPVLWDILLLLAWSKNHPACKKIWMWFGRFLWPKLLHLCGKLLDGLAYMCSQQPLEKLPLMKTKKGFSKRTPWVNKLILLQKVRLVRSHRKTAMESHADTVPKTAQIIMAEEFLCTAIYMKKLKETYQSCYHYAVAWDPSNYDIETLVSIVFSHQAGIDHGIEGVAAYLPIQNMRPVLRSEVDPEISALGAIKKLTRVAGYNEIRALSHSLAAIGFPLEKFLLPESLWWQTLTFYQERVIKDKKFGFMTKGQVKWSCRSQKTSISIPHLFSLQ